MKILIENGAHDCFNAGDLSMLKVCLNRLKSAYPNADLLTVSEAPQRLTVVFKDSNPTNIIEGRGLWLQDRNILVGYIKFSHLKIPGLIILKHRYGETTFSWRGNG